ncbi:hypothetical protein MA16_Dca018376 [Dendrobium catenatum]|uniref:Uncharacterized protein n=1 Tax=Dendrobium catenatum TaxID=906689 RepID=A0A2I0XAU3_9ASPA|nr:hypothetical protein MA16_Dca018376 [Dendrobium catenatum]
MKANSLTLNPPRLHSQSNFCAKPLFQSKAFASSVSANRPALIKWHLFSSPISISSSPHQSGQKMKSGNIFVSCVRVDPNMRISLCFSFNGLCAENSSVGKKWLLTRVRRPSSTRRLGSWPLFVLSL